MDSARTTRSSWRLTGLQELELVAVAAAASRAADLLPVLSYDYAAKIARERNVPGPERTDSARTV
jgi:hypothetical protein